MKKGSKIQEKKGHDVKNRNLSRENSGTEPWHLQRCDSRESKPKTVREVLCCSAESQGSEASGEGNRSKQPRRSWRRRRRHCSSWRRRRRRGCSAERKRKTNTEKTKRARPCSQASATVPAVESHWQRGASKRRRRLEAKERRWPWQTMTVTTAGGKRRTDAIELSKVPFNDLEIYVHANAFLQLLL